MSERPHIDAPESWPALPLNSWKETLDTLHMWTQMVGKVRLALTPLVNHWWNVPLYVHARGLTTTEIPYGDRAFELRFDFIDHQLVLEDNRGIVKTLPLEPQSVADFYKRFMGLLHSAEIQVHIWSMPVEIPDPIRFEDDHIHASYDREAVDRFWRILLTSDRIFHEFRSGFIGKCSPVHFFWGSFDLAVTRFSGRRAPERKDADSITREAYSHEVSSVGFWAGSGNIQDAAFYSYTTPDPVGFQEAKIRPAEARYDKQMGIFILMYDDLRKSSSPSATLLDFCQSAYEAGAQLGGWDRAALERQSAHVSK